VECLVWIVDSLVEQLIVTLLQQLVEFRQIRRAEVASLGALKMQDWKITDLNLRNLKFDGVAVCVSIARFC